MIRNRPWTATMALVIAAGTVQSADRSSIPEREPAKRLPFFSTPREKPAEAMRIIEIQFNLGFLSSKLADSFVADRFIPDLLAGVSSLASNALYFEAVSLHARGFYPRAAEKFIRVREFCPSYTKRKIALCSLFDIGNFWLEDTRTTMQQMEEFNAGKRLIVIPHLLTWDKRKPFFGEEQRATELMEKVYQFEPKSPLADKAAFLIGSVGFFREDYATADVWCSRVVEDHPKSTLAPQAVQLAIIAKRLQLDESANKDRLIAELRRLVARALKDYPEIRDDPRKSQMMIITLAHVAMVEREMKGKK